MSSVLFPVGIVIVLFVIYGVLRPSPGCTGGHCIGCDHSCDLETKEPNVKS